MFIYPDDSIDVLIKYNLKVKQVEVLGGIGLDVIGHPYVKFIIPDDVRFLFIARLLTEKDIHEFVQAAKN